MEEYRLGICDRDTGYMLGLMDYMNMCRDIPFQISVFTSVQDICREVEGGRIDMLLIDETLEVNQTEIPIVRLTEYREISDTEESVFKYQSMVDVCSKLLRIAKKKIKTASVCSGGFCAVYSPAGRSGVSMYALKLASENENSLLVKLENFRSTRAADDDAFMYYFLSRNDSIGNLVKSMPFRDDGGYKVIDGPLSYHDIRELKRGDLEWLRGIMIRDVFCETMIFDIGCGALSSFDILLAFDLVYIPCISEAEDKLNAFKKLIGYGSGSKFDKILKFIDMEA